MPNTSVRPIEMPQLSGGRERAMRLLAPLGDHLTGSTVQLDCTQLVAGTPSFADQTVLMVLVEGHADQLIVLHAGGRFAQYVSDAARDRGVSERVKII